MLALSRIVLNFEPGLCRMYIWWQNNYYYYLYQAMAKQSICVFNIVWQKYLDANNIIQILYGHYFKMAAKELKLQFP